MIDEDASIEYDRSCKPKQSWTIEFRHENNACDFCADFHNVLQDKVQIKDM